MKRSLPLLALALTTLLAPAAALAAPIAQPTSRFFEIRALVLGETRLEVSGKLWFDGTQLGASVGCNSIGAQVTVDGDVVTIVGSAVMTDMACPGVNGNAELMLGKILDLGRFTITDGKWSADGGSIEVVESPAADPNAIPPDPGSDPNGVVCITLQNGGPTGVNGVDVAPPPDPGSGSGNGSSGGGATGGATGGEVALPQPVAEATNQPAPTPIGVPCGGQISIDKVAPGFVGSTATPSVDTARDVLFVPLAIGFGLVLLVTAGLLLRGRATPR